MSPRRRRHRDLVPLEIAPLERRQVPAASLVSVNVSGSDAGDERSVGAMPRTTSAIRPAS